MCEFVGEEELLFQVADIFVAKVSIDFYLCRTLFDFGVEGVEIAEDVKLIAILKEERGDIALKGSLLITFEMVCSRCLKKYSFETSADIEGIFREKTSEEESEDGEFDDDSPDFSLYESDRIDIFPLIRDNVHLSVPIKPLCTESCRGVCPKCGTDRNEQSCVCTTDDIDPRLEVLRNFKGDN